MADEPDPTGPDDGKSRAGRKSKLTPELHAEAIALLSAGGFRTAVARTVGVSPSTFREWCRLGKAFPSGAYGEFARAVVKAEARAECAAVAKITGSGDPMQLRWWLERKYPQRWGQYRGELGELKRKLAALEKLLGDVAPPDPGDDGK